MSWLILRCLYSPSPWSGAGPGLRICWRPYATRDRHLAHLEDPREVVRGSIMPPFAYLSAEDKEALVDYLATLR